MTHNTKESIHHIFDSIAPDEYGCHPYPVGFPGYYCNVKIDMVPYKVHRLSLERNLGRQIRPGYHALHTCNFKSCVNPEHLYEGTSKDNIQDSIANGTHFSQPRVSRTYA
jgi:hypothetical protein